MAVGVSVVALAAVPADEATARQNVLTAVPGVGVALRELAAGQRVAHPHALRLLRRPAVRAVQVAAMGVIVHQRHRRHAQAAQHVRSRLRRTRQRQRTQRQSAATRLRKVKNGKLRHRTGNRSDNSRRKTVP